MPVEVTFETKKLSVFLKSAQGIFESGNETIYETRKYFWFKEC